MTVPNVLCRETYTATGSQSVYPYTFRILHAADLVVKVEDLDGVITSLVLDLDYTVDGVLSYTGGNITLTAGNLTADYVLAIFRDPEAVQDTSLQQQGAYDAKVIETALDLVTMEVQALGDEQGRSIQVPITTGDFDPILPAPVATQIVGINADGDGITLYTQAEIAAANANLAIVADLFVAGSDFTAGVTTELALSQDPGSINNTSVSFDGVEQFISTYSVAGDVVTFSSPIPVGTLEVQITSFPTVPYLAIPDGSITGPKLAAEAVTADKIAPGVLPTPNGIIDGGAMLANGADYAASVSGTYAYGKADLCKGALTGSTVAGTLTQVASSSLGRTGNAFKWSAVTTTGTGVAIWRFFIESKDALRFKNQTATASAQARQDTGLSINFSINIYKPTVVDDFTTLTAISSGIAQAVANATNTSLFSRAIAMGDCSNGILVEVTAAIGAVTNKNFELTEVQLEVGESETAFVYEPIEQLLSKTQRLFQKFVNVATTSFFGLGVGASTGAVSVPIPFLVEMRTTPTLATTAVGTFNVFVYSGGGSNVVPTGIALAASGTTKSGALLSVTHAAAFVVGEIHNFVSAAAAGASYLTFSARF